MYLLRKALLFLKCFHVIILLDPPKNPVSYVKQVLFVFIYNHR